VQQATGDLRKRLKKAERAWEKAEAEVAEIQRELAEPSLYEDNDRVQEVVARHEAAKDRVVERMEEWEAATQALEQAERNLGR
jgi:ATP-binding cassette subfamily F protein 3